MGLLRKSVYHRTAYYCPEDMLHQIGGQGLGSFEARIGGPVAHVWETGLGMDQISIKTPILKFRLFLEIDQ